MDVADLHARQLKAYHGLLRSVVGKAEPFVPRELPEGQIQADRGLALVGRLNGGEAAGFVLPPPMPSAKGPASRVVAVDQAGHRRPAYLPLVLACWLDGVGTDGRLPGWFEHLWLTRGPAVLATSGTKAADGERAVAETWDATVLGLAAAAFDRDDWRQHAHDVFARLVAGQTDAGPFLRFGGDDNPEPWWAQELALLQAVTTYAIRTGEPQAWAAAMRNAEYHLYETQPDHATAQPWGLNAFVLSDTARPMADQMMLSMDVNNSGRARGVSLLLVALTLLDLERRVAGLST